MSEVRYTNCTCPEYHIDWNGKKHNSTCPHMGIHLKYWFPPKKEVENNG